MFNHLKCNTTKVTWKINNYNKPTITVILNIKYREEKEEKTMDHNTMLDDWRENEKKKNKKITK